LGPKGVEYLAEALVHNTSITELSLGSNKEKRHE